MQSLKKETDYIELKKLGKNDVESLFHTEVSRVLKKPAAQSNPKEMPLKYKNIWYLKKETIAEDALREVIAQEIFRLCIPGHPKTRLVEQADGVIASVVSKEIPGYQCWEAMNERELNVKIKNGTYYGLGEILVVAMLVNEIDLKEGNLCLNDKKQVIKLDGDCCFARLAGIFKDQTYPITERDIRELPYVKDYFSNHWLNWIVNGVQKKSEGIFDIELTTLENFRGEVNRAILKLLILPDRLLRDFIRHHAPTRDETYILYNEVLARREQLRRAALKNETFCQYMLTPDAEKDLKSYLLYLNAFTITGKVTLNMSAHIKSIDAQYHRLIEVAKINVNRKVVNAKPKEKKRVEQNAEQDCVDVQAESMPVKSVWNSPLAFFASTIAELDILEENTSVRNYWGRVQ